ncbi:hypothetical protein O6H91_16G067900 [Diphasiastrum complanatum]|uniref:Uncharacterized protein n=2 Tax=Diphasiastrum complanatum TaxID=34168 RepID=A0ACC2BDB8_DIPCM|nr:hypothetical protein O6H91_16G067900 [Diphasiastrum complanatum]KAJ7527719.1 hypothetical protein O6H91_16G067900 [Diphasiastrum complanatum]
MEEAVAVESANDISVIAQTLEFPTEDIAECKNPGPALASNTSSAEEEYAFVRQNVEELKQKRDFEKAENGVENEHMQQKEHQKENPTSTGKRSLQYKVPKSGPSSQRIGQSVSQPLKRTPLSVGKGQSKVLQRADADDIPKRKRSTSERSHIEASEAIPLTSHRSPSLGAARGNFTVPQPFALATDKRASLGNRPSLSQVTKSSSKQTGNGCATTCSSIKKPQVFPKAMSRQSLVKATHLEVVKSSKEVKVKDIVQVEPTTTPRNLPNSPAKSKEELNSKSMIGFNFKCDERAEKRKEFYSKLEEKLNAKQAEKNEIQAKTQEEMEAEIKELRKSLKFKANPMPSFYQEAPPPKAELKKIPPTRAKSPKLGRRKSVNGLVARESSTFSQVEVHSVHLKSDDVTKSLDYAKNTRVPVMKANSSGPKLHNRKSLCKRLSDKTTRLKFEGEFDKSKSPAKSSFNSQLSCLDESVEIAGSEVEGSKVEGSTESTSPMAVKVAISTIGELIDTGGSNYVSDDAALICDTVQEHISKIGPAVAVDEVKEDGKEDKQDPENQLVNSIHETQGVIAVGTDRAKLRLRRKGLVKNGVSPSIMPLQEKALGFSIVIS